MRNWRVRVSCEYTTVVQAKSASAAAEEAKKLDMEEWDTSWSDFETEECEVPGDE